MPAIEMNTELDKDTLLSVLRDQLKLAKAHDRRIGTAHRAKCKAWETAVQAKLRDAAKLRGDELNEFLVGLENSYERKVVMPKQPSCPISIAHQFDEAITWVTRDVRTKFTIAAGGSHGWLFTLLRWVPDPKVRTVCAAEAA